MPRNSKPLAAGAILSLFVRASGVPQAGEEVHIEASQEQREALATLNKLAAVNSLQATLTVKPRGKELHVRGTIAAEVVYTCVVTLETFPAIIAEKINAIFAPRDDEDVHKHVDLSFNASEPEMLVDGRADIGALAQEFFQLALVPYPRKPGVNFEDLSSPCRGERTQ